MAVSIAFHAPVKVQVQKDLKELFLQLKFSRRDLIITEERVYQNYLKGIVDDCRVVIRDLLGRGPNTADTVEMAFKEAGSSYDRVIGIGGGAVLDLAKLLTLERPVPVKSLFEMRENIRKTRSCVLIPTTPGTGSEVTPYVALYISELGQQLILFDDELYADKAYLCPEFIKNMPFSPLAASMHDAFTHAFESYLSPLASPFSKTICKEAMQILTKAWLEIAKDGVSAIQDNLLNIQLAGSMGGIGYANAGCAAIHALSYPLSVRLGIHHGEANYLVAKEVVDLYLKKNPLGAIFDIATSLAPLLNTSPEHVFDTIDNLCQSILPRKRLSAFGMKENQILEFTDLVLTRQNLLISNGYVQLSAGEIANIYSKLI